MGGLFSSEPEVPRYQTPTYASSYSASRASSVRPQSSYCDTSSAYRTSNYGFEYEPSKRTSTFISRTVPSYANNNISTTRVSSSKTIISSADLKSFQQYMYSVVLRQATLLNWSITDAEYRLIPLESLSSEYNDIYKKFMRGVYTRDNNNINVKKIERVQNPYLMGQYYLKKLEYQNKGLPIQEKMLFHGTKSIYVHSICTNNFDWRLHGKTKGNIFGKGVSFTPKSPYANHYCDRNVNNKVMIVTKVVVSQICEGNKFMSIPPFYDSNRLLRFDTSIKESKKDVFVKYSDDEFYPAYLVHYSGKMYYHNKGFSR